MGDPFKCVRCNIWFDHYEALDEHVASVHPKPTERTAIANLQYELKEAMSEIDRHHNDFQKIRDVLDNELDLGDALRQIRAIVG